MYDLQLKHDDYCEYNKEKKTQLHLPTFCTVINLFFHINYFVLICILYQEMYN